MSDAGTTTTRAHSGDFGARSRDQIQHSQRQISWCIEQRAASIEERRKQVRATGNEALLP